MQYDIKKRVFVIKSFYKLESFRSGALKKGHTSKTGSHVVTKHIFILHYDKTIRITENGLNPDQRNALRHL